MASGELDGVLGYHNIRSTEARVMMQPYLHSDGNYLLRPSGDTKGGVLCTICVTNKSKLVNCRIVKDEETSMFYIHSKTSFPSIQLLLLHYQDSPINVDLNTRLLTPILTQQQQQIKPQNKLGRQKKDKQQRTQSLNSNYVFMQRNSLQSEDMSAADDATDSIPGLHEYLPKAGIHKAMDPYLATSGYFLVRPSASIEGQLTLAVSHAGNIMNFKINFEGEEYYISSRRRFKTMKELLDFYKNSHIRSKKCGSDKIFLLYPIPVDRVLEQQHKQLLKDKVARKESSSTKLSSSSSAYGPLPSPWQQHLHPTNNKHYYYNPETGESVWERPKATKTTPMPERVTSNNKSSNDIRSLTAGRRMKDRPLPSAPGDTAPNQSTLPSNLSPRRKESQPQQNGATQQFNLLQHPTANAPEKLSANFPPLPPKEFASPTLKRDQPRLPPREGAVPSRSNPPLPPKDIIQPPLPPKDGDGGSDLTTTSNSSMPHRAVGDHRLPLSSSSMSTNGIHPSITVPADNNTPPSQSFPPLPPKESISTSHTLPPLPPKEDESATPTHKMSYKELKGTGEGKNTVPFNHAPKSLSPTVSFNHAPKSPSPTLQNVAEKHTPSVTVNRIPPPPPPPPATDCAQFGSGIPPPPTGSAQFGSGIPPPPPPPPPMMSPHPSPTLHHFSRSETFSSAATSSPKTDTGSGRPFGVNDLMAARNLLRQRANTTVEPKPTGGGGMMSVLSGALDSRMHSIRRAVVDSDSEVEFDDVEDDWDD